jgi:hypothetical protein
VVPEAGFPAPPDARMPRAVVLARDAMVTVRIDEDLRDHVRFEHADSIAALGELVRRAPQPQIIVVELELLDARETLQLHEVRGGWFGSIVAVGEVTAELRSSLGIQSVIPARFERGALRAAIRELGLNKSTTRMTHQKK